MMLTVKSFIASFLLFISLVSCLRFEIPAAAKPDPLCIRDFVHEGQMVVLNIDSGNFGDGQTLSLKVKDSSGNSYANRNDISGKIRIAFKTEHNSFDVCFTNKLDHKWSRHERFREIDLEIESGSASRDWNSVQAAEKLKPNELDLLKVDDLTEEIINELSYLKAREERMRDTNESTNSRVKWFSVLIVGSLIGFGAWQVQYLRHYFKVKHII